MSIDLNRTTEDAMASSRRRLLLSAGSGFGQLALFWMLCQDGVLGSRTAAEAADSVRARPKLRSRADSIIFLFMQGGPSHVDLFDPKPMLQKRAGQALPASVFGSRPVHSRPVLASRSAFRHWGKSGMPIADLLPEAGKHADRLCLIRSCMGDSANHIPAIQELNTGATRVGRPSLGAWSLYGLGSENQNLPGYVVLRCSNEPLHQAEAWGAGFLPARFQGTPLEPVNPPIANLNPPPGTSRERSRITLDIIRDLNRRYRVGREELGDLDARASAYELAFRMQSSARDVVDLSGETAATRKLYGLDDPTTEEFGQRCLVARRLVEKGVRFVQVYCGYNDGWDAHFDLDKKLPEMCARTDRPIAGLLTDLQARGLLDRTLVVWGGEFGRSPTTVSGSGRDHNPTGFSMWLAGGGTAGGRIIGATDDYGMWAVDEPCQVNDIHSTLLHLMGLESHQVTVRANGRDEHPTVNGGSVIMKALG